MALDTATGMAPYEAPEKDLYEIGEMPPLGYVPKNMYAWAIRRERHGEPEQSFQVEVVPTWQIDSHEVLVLVMACRSRPLMATKPPIILPVQMPRASCGPWVTR